MVECLTRDVRGRGFKPHRRHCVVSLSKNINPSLVLVQPRKTRPFIIERLLMGRKESNQTNKQKICAVMSLGSQRHLLDRADTNFKLLLIEQITGLKHIRFLMYQPGSHWTICTSCVSSRTHI